MYQPVERYRAIMALLFFSLPKHQVLRVSYCDHSQFVGVCPFTFSFFVHTLASTDINQSATHFVKTYVTIRPWMTSIMDLIGPELSELSSVEVEKLPYLT